MSPKIKLQQSWKTRNLCIYQQSRSKAIKDQIIRFHYLSDFSNCFSFKVKTNHQFSAWVSLLHAPICPAPLLCNTVTILLLHAASLCVFYKLACFCAVARKLLFACHHRGVSRVKALGYWIQVCGFDRGHGGHVSMEAKRKAPMCCVMSVHVGVPSGWN